MKEVYGGKKGFTEKRNNKKTADNNQKKHIRQSESNREESTIGVLYTHMGK